MRSEILLSNKILTELQLKCTGQTLSEQIFLQSESEELNQKSNKFVPESL